MRAHLAHDPAPYDDAAVRRLRGHIMSTVRGRVPSGDAEDVAQTVLCDALAAEAVPTDPTDLVRWVKGVARHKVADYHRASRRFGPDEPNEPAQPPAPFEARSLLRWVMRQLGTRASDAETFSWLVRESSGERLDAMAREAGLPAEVVRQRVSRLRRLLRSRWLTELALAGAIVLCAAGALHSFSHGSANPAIVPDYPAAGGATGSALDTLQGNWKVESMTAARDLDPARRALTAVSPAWIDVTVQGNVLRVSAPGHASTRTLTVDSVDGNAVVVTLSGGPAGPERARIDLTGRDSFVVTAEDGAWRGSGVLRRGR